MRDFQSQTIAAAFSGLFKSLNFALGIALEGFGGEFGLGRCAVVTDWLHIAAAHASPTPVSSPCRSRLLRLSSFLLSTISFPPRAGSSSASSRRSRERRSPPSSYQAISTECEWSGDLLFERGVNHALFSQELMANTSNLILDEEVLLFFFHKAEVKCVVGLKINMLEMDGMEERGRALDAELLTTFVSWRLRITAAPPHFQVCRSCLILPHSHFTAFNLSRSSIFPLIRQLGTPNEEMWPGVSKLANWHEYPQWTLKSLSLVVTNLYTDGIDLLLHRAGAAACCECMRLFPPVLFDSKFCIDDARHFNTGAHTILTPWGGWKPCGGATTTSSGRRGVTCTSRGVVGDDPGIDIAWRAHVAHAATAQPLHTTEQEEARRCWRWNSRSASPKKASTTSTFQFFICSYQLCLPKL
ncbi:Cyclin-dependent kinase B2-2 [Platanthera guangdongensis]|uniref:Cyclin-dependent kinase B2-2 n=1 Tax=Platanthera guangdongensis TaxID=2320717 RepID=A0ABR2LUP0_9ASPA